MAMSEGGGERIWGGGGAMAENVMAQSQGNEDRGGFVSADGTETFWVSWISTSS